MGADCPRVRPDKCAELRESPMPDIRVVTIDSNEKILEDQAI
jgi:hypothetical protein